MCHSLPQSTPVSEKDLHSMEVAEEIEHIPYGDEITSFQDALKGNSANFEKRLGRVWFDLTQ